MELSIYQIIWIISGSVLVIGWLVISFTPPSRNRTVIEWLSATAMYAAIVIAMIPSVAVYVMLHERIIAGLTSGAVKG